jgi:hypothetical protein
VDLQSANLKSLSLQTYRQKDRIKTTELKETIKVSEIKSQATALFSPMDPYKIKINIISHFWNYLSGN